MSFCQQPTWSVPGQHASHFGVLVLLTYELSQNEERDIILPATKKIKGFLHCSFELFLKPQETAQVEVTQAGRISQHSN
ncbi:hypothetical protein AV530_007399 [Patagioenas fasciata monilis]|uniref:Uncharacterized protein n=1 Tax=Patagioenas fasciata monilis TaxID=372326 RepID=A0A1V4JXV4_PATFA|nr:hypothetical protein AV530_007399 [Patagioenas fasciata monilis]